MPEVNSVDEFEICREVKEKGRATGKYELLEGSESVKDAIVPWEAVFIRYRDSAGTFIIAFGVDSKIDFCVFRTVKTRRSNTGFVDWR